MNDKSIQELTAITVKLETFSRKLSGLVEILKRTGQADGTHRSAMEAITSLLGHEFAPRGSKIRTPLNQAHRTLYLDAKVNFEARM